MEILDMKCAECGNMIALIKDNSETLITKSLGVLQEDGIYAFYIYLLSRGKKEEKPALKTTYLMFRLLKERDIFKTSEPLEKFKEEFTENNERKNYIESLLSSIRNELAQNIDSLLLSKELLERTLIYARYHAKALDSGTSGGGA